MLRTLLCMTLVCLLTLPQARAQEPVTILVQGESRIGGLKPIWRYFGYDEPNYTYMKNGQKLVSELTRLSPVQVQSAHTTC